MFDQRPTDPDLVRDPAWLAEALGTGVAAVEPVDTSRTVAEKLRFVVTLDDGRRLPLCAKGHFDDSGINSLRTEAHAYRDLHPTLDVRAPVAHHVGVDDGGGLILMDDVVGLGGRFFEPGAAYPLDACRDALDQLARLHAATWDDPRWDVDWLAPRFDQMTEVFGAEALQRLLDDSRADGLDPALRDAEALRTAMAVAGAVPATCVLHGDTHSGNAYRDAEGRVGWLDWQITQRGHWSTDVSYHLGTVLDVDTRRAHEADLLAHYLDALGPVAPGFDEAWDAYRVGFVWGWFLWTITSISSREVVLVHVPRLGTAMTDRDTYGRLGVTT